MDDGSTPQDPSLAREGFVWYCSVVFFLVLLTLIATLFNDRKAQAKFEADCQAAGGVVQHDPLKCKGIKK